MRDEVLSLLELFFKMEERGEGEEEEEEKKIVEEEEGEE